MTETEYLSRVAIKALEICRDPMALNSHLESEMSKSGEIAGYDDDKGCFLVYLWCRICETLVDEDVTLADVLLLCEQTSRLAPATDESGEVTVVDIWGRQTPMIWKNLPGISIGVKEAVYWSK